MDGYSQQVEKTVAMICQEVTSTLCHYYNVEVNTWFLSIIQKEYTRKNGMECCQLSYEV